MSPYLFLICVEGLSSLLAHEEEIGGIQGIRVCRGAPSVSHQLFVDDSLILMKADASNATSLRNALDMYCASFGQLVSDAKSSIFFSPSIDINTKAQVCTTLNIMTEALNDTKLTGWKEKCLSSGGKEVLIKSVAQAIPTYAMSVFKIPKKL